MTRWLTTGEEESCGTENNDTAVNKYSCGGRLIFRGQFFSVLPLWDASIFQYGYFSSLWKSEYFLFSSDKSFIGKKPQLSIIR